MGKERIIELIDQVENIKSKLESEHFTMISSYDFKSKQRKQGGIEDSLGLHCN